MIHGERGAVAGPLVGLCAKVNRAGSAPFLLDARTPEERHVHKRGRKSRSDSPGGVTNKRSAMV